MLCTANNKRHITAQYNGTCASLLQLNQDIKHAKAKAAGVKEGQINCCSNQVSCSLSGASFRRTQTAQLSMSLDAPHTWQLLRGCSPAEQYIQIAGQVPPACS
jgi:hypothetical protein